MKRLEPTAIGLLVLLACSAAPGADEPAPPPLQIEEVPSPAAHTAQFPVLAAAPDGTVWMVWAEPDSPVSARWALRCCEFDVSIGRWRSAHSIASSRMLDPAGGLPSVAACGNGQMWVSWPEAVAGTDASRSFFCSSTDGGDTWTEPSPVSRKGGDAAFPGLAALADGRILAAWIDRGGRSSPGAGAGVYLRFLTGPLTAAPDWLLDGRADPEGQPNLVPLLDGGAILAYRGISDTGALDPRIARLHGRKWEDPHPISADGWNGAGAGGPRIAADGGRLVTVWRTANPADPHILVSTSPDAGGRFLTPLQVNAGNPAGLPAAALLHDGAALIAWSESPSGGPAGAWVRRLAPENSLDAPFFLGLASSQYAAPQIVIVHDYAGDAFSAQAIVAYGSPGGSAGLRTVLLNVPEADLLSVANAACHCAPTPMQLIGYALLGTVVSVGPGRASVVIESDAVPGVLDSGRHDFAVDPQLGTLLQPGRECLAHIVRKDGGWRLYDARLLEPAR
jgi:hypothetical protein